ncbi:uncharacterized protein LOC123507367 isoform X1 [Portunus trituberculatus]|uniref:uncharacterized protein LOC123507367 isoform X1 n=1 Tax=Portunus trituberculatus TaxID=210409 RepID=UPI001E1CC6F2|nr:uncharacterized protein LOC123507367 isoform X1 [Portunus trituberculatus]
MRASGAVFLLTAALTGFTQAAWLENFSQNLCRTDIRCYTKTYHCSRILNVPHIQRVMTQVLAYCYSLLGSSTLRSTTFTEDDLIDVMSGVHGEQLPDCVLVQMGLVVDGRVNQAGLYLALANTVISNNFNQQNTFLDAISTCPAPSKPQLASFGACVIQACVSAL